MKKGDVLTVAKIAGINGAKQTHNLIPLCHSLLLSKVDVQLWLDPLAHAVQIEATAKTSGQTGITQVVACRRKEEESGCENTQLRKGRCL